MRGRRRARKSPLAEINVTPLVDVMLVLLIIFMVSAPLLNPGVPVELPKTEAGAVDTSDEPINVTIDETGRIFVGETESSWDNLIARVADQGGDKARERPIFLRADGRAPYQAVARVMARLSANGFTKMNLITDTAGAVQVPASSEGLRPAQGEP